MFLDKAEELEEALEGSFQLHEVSFLKCVRLKDAEVNNAVPVKFCLPL